MNRKKRRREGELSNLDKPCIPRAIPSENRCRGKSAGHRRKHPTLSFSHSSYWSRPLRRYHQCRHHYQQCRHHGSRYDETVESSTFE